MKNLRILQIVHTLELWVSHLFPLPPLFCISEMLGHKVIRERRKKSKDKGDTIEEARG